MAALRSAVLLIALSQSTALVVGALTPHSKVLRPYGRPMVATMVAEPPQTSDISDEPPAPKRETAEEAWEKAPEGSFLSPALAGALVLSGMLLRSVLLGGSETGLSL